MQLTITEPTAQKTYTIDWLSVDTPSGTILFQEHHSPTIVTIQSQSIVTFQTAEGEPHKYPVTHAVLEVTRSSAHILNQG